MAIPAHVVAASPPASDGGDASMMGDFDFNSALDDAFGGDAPMAVDEIATGGHETEIEVDKVDAGAGARGERGVELCEVKVEMMAGDGPSE